MTQAITEISNPAYIVTGPTAGIGRATALELAKYGTVILVGRNREKLRKVQKSITRQGHHAVSVACDLSDLNSVGRAAQEIIDLNLPVVGLFNNAGMVELTPTKNAQGWDTTFATNHLGPFALTEALVPHLPDGATVIFVGSAVEDPERQLAKRVGFRGSRFISVAASARGEWKPGGSKRAGADAYASSKQCNIVTALAFARQFPRLYVNAFEPGFTPGTDLGRDQPWFMQLIIKHIFPFFAPHIEFWSTPELAARVGVKLLINRAKTTGVYYNESGEPIPGSPAIRDAKFADTVVAETRAFLAAAGQHLKASPLT
jgi:NAD(P)-dependent dehydrogenase (short-subunit alcohol dehydrogenase family)